MNIEWGTIEFGSMPLLYRTEESGVKPHTLQLITAREAKRLDSGGVKRICIRNTETGFCFVRKITNIHKEADVFGDHLYSFTWTHEGDEKVLKGRR